MKNQEMNLLPETDALLDTLLAEWSMAHQIAPDELDALRESILTKTSDLPAEWWNQHMAFFYELKRDVDTAQQSVAQMLSHISVHVQMPTLSFTTFSGGTDWQPYLKLT